MDAALESVHRYDPEPNFSKTGVGSLRTATPEERKQEEARGTALVGRLKKRKLEAELKSLGQSVSPNEPAGPNG